MAKKKLSTEIIKQLLQDPEMAWYKTQAPLHAVKSAGKQGRGSDELNQLIDIYHDLNWLIAKEQPIIESLTTNPVFQKMDIIQSLEDITVIAAVMKQGVTLPKIKRNIRNTLQCAKEFLNLIQDWADVYYDVSYQFITNSIVIDQIRSGRSGKRSGFILLVTPASRRRMKVLSYVRSIYAHTLEDSFYRIEIEYRRHMALDGLDTVAEKLLANQAVGRRPFHPASPPAIYFVGVTQNYNYSRIIKPVVENMFEQEVFANS